MKRPQINFRLTNKEKVAIYKQAAANEKTVSRYLVECALDRGRKVSTLDIETLTRTNDELVKIQASLNRLTALAENIAQNRRSAQALDLAKEIYRLLKPLSKALTEALCAVLKALETK